MQHLHQVCCQSYRSGSIKSQKSQNKLEYDIGELETLNPVIMVGSLAYKTGTCTTGNSLDKTGRNDEAMPLSTIWRPVQLFGLLLSMKFPFSESR
jgi:hypothetical protein